MYVVWLVLQLALIKELLQLSLHFDMYLPSEMNPLAVILQASQLLD